MSMFSIDGGSPQAMKMAIAEHEARNNKPEPMGYCKFCEFQSDDSWKQNDHFKETGHDMFLPENLLHERVFTVHALSEGGSK